MNRQKILDNFVKATHGKGRSFVQTGGESRPSMGECRYFNENHPGCGIGCQPGFREAFVPFRENIEGQSIENLLTGRENQFSFQGRMRQFFDLTIDEEDAVKHRRGKRVDEDVKFLIDVQSLHDNEDNWIGDEILNPTVLQEFADKWNLQNPQEIN